MENFRPKGVLETTRDLGREQLRVFGSSTMLVVTSERAEQRGVQERTTERAKNNPPGMTVSSLGRKGCAHVLGTYLEAIGAVGAILKSFLKLHIDPSTQGGSLTGPRDLSTISDQAVTGQ